MIIILFLWCDIIGPEADKKKEKVIADLTSSPPTHLLAALGLIYTRSQGQKKLGLTWSIFGLLFGPKLLVNAGTLAIPKDCKNWLPKFDGILFYLFSLGAQYKAIKFSIY